MKGLEALQEICGYYYQSPQYNLIEQELKALEILKRIDVNIQELLGWLLDNDYDGYFDSVIDKVEDIRYVLTKQEFIFLKGILL